ncbi:MAG: hypothetical protein HOY79_46120, partial [Streptomyces sp.]|nr:hypothetical protein [Streptomyces sp.]
MTATNKEAQAAAVLFLAAGKSKAEAARQAGVRPATVAAWLKKPAYVAEVEAFRAVLATRPGRDALLAAVEESRRRIMGASATPG